MFEQQQQQVRQVRLCFRTDLDDDNVDLVHCGIIVGLALEDGCKQPTHQSALEQARQVLLQHGSNPCQDQSKTRLQH